MTLAERTEARRKKIVAHRSHGYAEAQRWDLEFWQRQSPEMRLSALMAIRRDVAMVMASRKDR